MTAGPKVCFDEPQCSNNSWGRAAASLIGCLGQARFPSFFWAFVSHPGHASLRSLGDAMVAPLHAYVGSAVESLALRRASSGAADTFGFFHEPRPVRDDPVRLSVGRPRSYYALHFFLTELRTICPHPVQQNGEFARDSYNGATTTLGSHKPHAPRFDLRPGHRSHEKRIRGGVQRRTDVSIPSF